MPEFPEERAANPLRPNCRRCPELAAAREHTAWGNGPRDAAVVVVGEAPAAGDPDADRWRGGNLTGLAYTSRRSGRKVRELLADCGYAGDAYYTNAVKCFPPDPDDPTDNREPTAEERANCHPHLVAEIEAVDPAAVLPTGSHATRSVLATEGVSYGGNFTDSVLEPVRCDHLDTTVVPLVHPSYQEVWIPRLGYDYEGYVDKIRELLTDRT